MVQIRWFIFITDTYVLYQVIDQLSPKSSFRFDGLSSKLWFIFLKSIKNVITKPITIIINQMINTGIFSDKIKIAKIVPIYKKDDETHFTNYRHIFSYLS